MFDYDDVSTKCLPKRRAGRRGGAAAGRPRLCVDGAAVEGGLGGEGRGAERREAEGSPEEEGEEAAARGERGREGLTGFAFNPRDGARRSGGAVGGGAGGLTTRFPGPAMAVLPALRLRSCISFSCCLRFSRWRISRSFAFCIASSTLAFWASSRALRRASATAWGGAAAGWGGASVTSALGGGEAREEGESGASLELRR